MNEAVLKTRAGRFFWSVTAYPKTVLSLGLLVMLATAALLPHLTQDTSPDAFFPQDHPSVVFRNKVKEIFGLADPVAIAVVNKGPNGIFNPHSLSLVSWLTEQIADIPGIDPDRVTSLATENNIIGTEDGFQVDPFFEMPPQTQEEAGQIRQAVLDFELYVGNLVARDGQATLIVAELLDENRATEVYTQLLALTQKAPVQGEELHVAGDGAANGYLDSYVDADAQRRIPIALLVIIAILFLAYRTLRGVLLPVLAILGALTVAFGLMAAAGIPYYVVTSALPVILIAIGVADGIHILGQYYEEIAQRGHLESRELAVRSMVEMWRPVTITSVTDMAGFLALAFSSYMLPMRAFGLFAALGVFSALLFSLVVIPAALTLLKPRPSRAIRPAMDSDRNLRVDSFGWAMGAIGHWAVRRPGWVLVVAGLVVGAGIVGATRLEVNEERIKNFQPTEPIVEADRVINQRINGTNYLDIVVQTDAPEALFQPGHLRRIEALQKFVTTLPHVTGATSIVDYVKQMNRALNQNRPDAYRVPDDSDLIAQYFLLYAASGDPTDFENEVDYDYQLANMRVALDSGRFSDEKVVVIAVTRYLDEHFNAPGISAQLAGRVNVDYHWVKQLASSHFRGTVMALIAVWVMVTISFRSVIAGALAIIPVSLAVLFIYALMGFTGMWLAVGTSMSAAIAIGTGVDFSVHVVDRLLVLLRDKQRSLEEALPTLFPSTGRMLLFNFSAVFLGFGVLLTSHIPPLVQFGSLICMGVAMSFLTSIIVLPALVHVFRPAIFRPAPDSMTHVFGVMILAAGLLLSTPPSSHGQDKSWPAGEDIAQRINARDDGQAVSRTLLMELIDRRGKKRVRQTRAFRKYVDAERRTVIFYLSPKNIKGTAFLTHDYQEKDREDTQWLYLPAMRKVRRISAANRGDYFLGTDFTYDDIKLGSKVNLADYSRTTTGEDKVDDHHCYVVEAIPVNKKVAKELGYSRVQQWVDSQIWMTRKAEFWDRKGNPLKQIRFHDIQQIQGIWTARRIEVQNHKTGHRTVFVFSDIDYEKGVDDEMFTKQALSRGP